MLLVAVLLEPWEALIAIAFLAWTYTRGARAWTAFALGTYLGAIGYAAFVSTLYRGSKLVFLAPVVATFAVGLITLVLSLSKCGRPWAFGPWARGWFGVAFLGLVLVAGCEAGRELLRMVARD